MNTAEGEMGMRSKIQRLISHNILVPRKAFPGWVVFLGFFVLGFVLVMVLREERCLRPRENACIMINIIQWRKMYARLRMMLINEDEIDPSM